jgi:hypothetical protein
MYYIARSPEAGTGMHIHIKSVVEQGDVDDGGSHDGLTIVSLHSSNFQNATCLCLHWPLSAYSRLNIRTVKGVSAFKFSS